MKILLVTYAIGWLVLALLIFAGMMQGRARRETVEGKAPLWAIALIASSVGLLWPVAMFVLVVKIVWRRGSEKRLVSKLGVIGEEMKREMAQRAAERVRSMPKGK